MSAAPSSSEPSLDELRKAFSDAHRAAEKAAYALFGALPVGPERNRMSEVYENVRTATRVPL